MLHAKLFVQAPASVSLQLYADEDVAVGTRQKNPDWKFGVHTYSYVHTATYVEHPKFLMHTCHVN